MSYYQPEDLFAAIGVAPALPGARCRGRSHLFDGPGQNEDNATVTFRHDHALRLCRGCPALHACRTWFDSLPERERPEGVVAGRLQLPRPMGRPRKRKEPA